MTTITGAVCFGLGFRNLPYKSAFILMGICILVSGVLAAFIIIKGSSTMFCGGDDSMHNKPSGEKGEQTLMVPEKDEIIAEEIEC